MHPQSKDPLKSLPTLDAMTVQINAALVAQCARNTAHVATGRQADYPWHRELYTEAVAALAEQASDFEAYRRRLVAIWGLALLRYLALEPVETAHTALPRRLALNLRSAFRKHRPFPGSRPEFLAEKRCRLLDKLISRAAAGDFCLDSFAGLMVHSGLDFSRLHSEV